MTWDWETIGKSSGRPRPVERTTIVFYDHVFGALQVCRSSTSSTFTTSGRIRPRVTVEESRSRVAHLRSFGIKLLLNGDAFAVDGDNKNSTSNQKTQNQVQTNLKSRLQQPKYVRSTPYTRTTRGCPERVFCGHQTSRRRRRRYVVDRLSMEEFK